MSDSLNVEGWSCPAPLRDYPTVVLGHGGGGRLMTDLIDHLFLEAFSPGGEARGTGRPGRGDRVRTVFRPLFSP